MTLTLSFKLTGLVRDQAFDLDQAQAMVVEQGEAALEAVLIALEEYATHRLVYFCQQGRFPGDDR